MVPRIMKNYSPLFSVSSFSLPRSHILMDISKNYLFQSLHTRVYVAQKFLIKKAFKKGNFVSKMKNCSTGREEKEAFMYVL